MLGQFVVFYATAFAAHIAFVGTGAAACSALGVHIIEAKVGMGRILRLGKLKIGAIPITGSVYMANIHEHKGQFAEESLFENRPRIARVTILVSGAAGVLLLALVLRGATALRSFVNAFEQIFNGALAPNTCGAELVSTYLQLLESEGPSAGIGVLLAKIAALQLLPLPLSAGGASLIHLLWPARQGPGELAWRRISQVGLVLSLALMLPWLWAIYTALSVSRAAPAS